MDETQKNLDINALLDALPDDDTPLEVDPEKDAFAAPPPPPDDTYVAKLALGPKKFMTGTSAKGVNFVMAHIMAKIIDEGKRTNNQVVFANESDMVFNGTSRISGVLSVLGFKAKRDYQTRREMIELLGTALGTEPVVQIKTRWELSAETGVNPSTGKKVYETVLKGMKNFPVNEDGSYNPSPSGTFPLKSGGTVTLDGSAMAQATIVAYKAAN